MASNRRKCKHDPDVFCYICGCFTTVKQRQDVTDFVRKAYFAYFGMKLGDQDKPWAPHSVCRTHVENLRQWTKGKRKSFAFGIPMVWREPQNHFDDCYFCIVNIFGFNAKTKSMIKYPNLPSAIRPMPHSDEVPVPVFTTLEGDDESEENLSEGTNTGDEEFTASLIDPKVPKLFCQAELNDLVHDLDLPKESAELLGSRLNEKNLLAPGTTFSFFRNRERELVKFFNMEDEFVFCHDIPGLLAAMGCQYDVDEWRLFIDISKSTLKCVLLHNGNEFASIPIGHSVHLKENYENMKTVLSKMKYNEHNWIICGDLKVIGLLLGQQGGYTKFPCFLFVGQSQ